MKLSAAQKAHLIRIGAFEAEHPDMHRQGFSAGWMGSRSEQSLETKGLVRHWTEKRPLGGGGAIGYLSVAWNFCELTDDGWRELADVLGQANSTR